MMRESTYIATLPEGYEWRMMEIGRHGLRLIGCHPKKAIKMYRLDGLTLVEEEIKFHPIPPDDQNMDWQKPGFLKITELK